MNEVKETENEWKQKRMHGQYVREKEGIDWDRTWQWIAKGDLKGCTEALMCSALEQGLLYEISYWSFSRIPFVQNVRK